MGKRGPKSQSVHKNKYAHKVKKKPYKWAGQSELSAYLKEDFDHCMQRSRNYYANKR